MDTKLFNTYVDFLCNNGCYSSIVLKHDLLFNGVSIWSFKKMDFVKVINQLKQDFFWNS
jgi:hypothetical protein